MADRNQDIANVVYFLFHLKRDKPGTMYGAISVQEAFDSFAALVFPTLTPVQLEARLAAEEESHDDVG